MRFSSIFYKTCVLLLKPIVKIFFPYEIKGKENADKISGGYILCSNHLSAWDPILLMVARPRPVYFMAKSELFKNKILGRILYALGTFPVKRGKGDGEAIKHAAEISTSGNILGIFIEGTRSKTGEFLRPRSGVALLASETESPILPVCITGSSKDNKIHIFKRTFIVYGDPIVQGKISIDNNARKEIKERTHEIMESIKDLRRVEI